MSQANVEIVREGNALLNAGDLDALSLLCHPNVEFCDLRSAVDTPEILKGVEAVQALLADWIKVWDSFGAEVYEYVDADPYVICDVRWYGTVRESKFPLDARQADLYELRGGKIIRVTLGYASKSEALEAVGLEE